MRIRFALVFALLLSASPLTAKVMAQAPTGLALLREAAQVERALADDPVLRAYPLDTDAVDGRIVLRGKVRTDEERTRAEALAGANATAPVQNALSLDPESGLDPAFRTETDAPPVALPEPRPAPVTAPTPQPIGPPETREETDAEDEPEAAPEPEPEPAATSEVYHTVKSGDSLYAIARQYGTSVAAIQRLNGIRGSRIKPGQQLRVK
jgi:LysM repeat protein